MLQKKQGYRYENQRTTYLQCDDHTPLMNRIA